MQVYLEEHLRKSIWYKELAALGKLDNEKSVDK